MTNIITLENGDNYSNEFKCFIVPRDGKVDIFSQEFKLFN